MLRLGLIRAVLMADRCLIFCGGTPDAEYIANSFLLPIAVGDLGAAGLNEELLARGFEMNCLEAMLAITSRRLRRRAECFRPVIQRLLYSAASSEPEASLAQLLTVSRALVELERFCTSIIQCLERVLATDEEMLSFLLTARDRLIPGQKLPKSSHEVVETILESYLFAFRCISDSLFVSRRAIETTQYATRWSLEHKRTRLIHFNVHLSIATLSVGMIACIIGLFGMNVPLPASLSESPTAFVAVSVCAFAAGIILQAAATLIAQKRQPTKFLQLHQAWVLIDREPQLADVLLKHLDTQVMLDATNSGDAVSPREPKISFDEFCELLAKVSDHAPKEVRELRNIFNMMDVNGDGVLQLEEIAELLCVMSSSAPMGSSS